MKQRVITPTTSVGENSRIGGIEGQKGSQAHHELNMFEGKIKKVDPLRKIVQVSERNSGNTMFGGQWITLLHSVHDIVDRFGTVRPGMEVLVFYKGRLGSPVTAYAMIIGEENEIGPNQDFGANIMGRGFHNILMENL